LQAAIAAVHAEASSALEDGLATDLSDCTIFCAGGAVAGDRVEPRVAWRCATDRAAWRLIDPSASDDLTITTWRTRRVRTCAAAGENGRSHELPTSARSFSRAHRSRSGGFSERRLDELKNNRTVVDFGLRRTNYIVTTTILNEEEV